MTRSKISQKYSARHLSASCLSLNAKSTWILSKQLMVLKEMNCRLGYPRLAAARNYLRSVCGNKLCGV